MTMPVRARTATDYASTRALRKALTSVEEEPNKMDESTMSQSHRRRPGDTSLDESWDWVLTNYDVGTTHPQSIRQELQRLQVLKSYMILDEDREEAFDRLTNMAARIFNVPIALVSLVDLGRQWFMSNHGLGDVRETPRNLAFCAHAVQGRNDLFIVRDALEDLRFCDSPLVQGAPFIRFYAGAPLLSPEGYKLGTFCIIDSKPRPDGLSPADQANLTDFAAMAMKAMVDRRQITSQQDTSHLVACTAHELLTPLMGVQLNLSLLEEEAAHGLATAHKECLSNAIRSSDWLHRICQTTIEALRQDEANRNEKDKKNKFEPSSTRRTTNASSTAESPFIDMQDFVASLNLTMESIPKRVPLILTVDDSVPARIVSDDLKLFRSSLNLLSNAFANTSKGSVHFHIHASAGMQHQLPLSSRRGSVEVTTLLMQQPEFLVFECIDTGPDLQVDDPDCLFKPSAKTLGVVKDLGLYSVAYQVESLGGSYGYQSRRDTEQKQGSVFWFQVPIVLPEDVNSHNGGSFASLSMMDVSDSGHSASLATLDSSVIHFPPVVSPPTTTKPRHHSIQRRHPQQQPHLQNLSVSYHGGTGYDAHRRQSMSNHETLQQQIAVNRSGIMAVAAASMPKCEEGTSSCCELSKLAEFGGTLEAYKEHQIKERNARSKSPLVSRQARLRAFLSWDDATAVASTPLPQEPQNSDSTYNNRRFKRNPVPKTAQGLLFRRTHSTGDSSAARALKALMAKKMAAKEETSTAETSGTEFSEMPGPSETPRGDAQEPASATKTPVPKTIQISNKNGTKEGESAAVESTVPNEPPKPFAPVKTPSPLFDVKSNRQEPAADTPKPLFAIATKGQEPAAVKLPQPLFAITSTNKESIAEKPTPLFALDSNQQTVTDKPQPLFATASTSQESVADKPKPLFDTTSASQNTESTKPKPLFATASTRTGQATVAEKPKSLFAITSTSQNTESTKPKPILPVASTNEQTGIERPKPLFGTGSTSENTKTNKPKPLFGGVSDKNPPTKPLFSISPNRGTDDDKTAKLDKATEPSNTNLQNEKALSVTRQKKALVIEDTVVVRKTLTRALQKRGYEVSQANDGVEGLAALKETVFDITLCDFLMPNMDGLDCVQQYRQWEKENRAFEQHIVGISAHVSQKDVDKGLEIGMNGFRPKPITMKTLQELDGSPAMEQVRADLDNMHATSSPGMHNTSTSRDAENLDGSAATNVDSAAKTQKSCLMATGRFDGETRQAARKMSDDGWAVTIVENGSSALEQLKSRNWGAVVLDDHLPALSGNQCVEEFRAWESQNRVNRQGNLFIVCTDVVLPPDTNMLPPAGFDGAMDSQVSWDSLQNLIGKQTSRRSTREGLSIVTR